MHLFHFIVGLLVYLVCQSFIAYLWGLGGWVIFWLDVAALVLAQVLFLVWIAVLTRREARKKAENRKDAPDVVPAKDVEQTS